MSTHVFVRYVSIIFSKALKTISIYLTLFSSFSIKVRILSTHYFGNVWKVSKLVPWKENGRKWSNTQENILLKKQLKKSHFYRRQFSFSILGYYHHLKTKEENKLISETYGIYDMQIFELFICIVLSQKWNKDSSSCVISIDSRKYIVCLLPSSLKSYCNLISFLCIFPNIPIIKSLTLAKFNALLRARLRI